MWRRFLRPVLKRLFGPLKRAFAAHVLSATRKVVFSAGPGEIRSAQSKIAVEFREGSEADLARFGPSYDYSSGGLSFARSRLVAGDRLVVAEHGGDIVFYAWLMFGQLDLNTGAYLPMSPARAYTYKIFTSERFRRCGLASAYFAQTAQWLKQMGYRELVLQVRADNGPSLATTERAGFRRVGSIIEWRVLGQLRFTVPAALRRRLTAPAS